MILEGMLELRRTFTEIALAFSPGSCEGSALATYGGVACGTAKQIASAVLDDIGAVSGSTDLLPGDTGAYYYTFSPSGNLDSLQYTGTLEYVSAVAGGAVLRMPADAEPLTNYTASWSASCGRVATLTVRTVPECTAAVPTGGPGMFTYGDVVRIPPAPSSVDDPEYHIDRGLGHPDTYTYNECGTVIDVVPGGVSFEIIGEYWFGRWDSWITQRCTSWMCTYGHYVTYISQPPVNGEGIPTDWPYQTHRVIGGIYT
jgi:hypothetical protein